MGRAAMPPFKDMKQKKCKSAVDLLSDEQIYLLKDAFDVFDPNETGVIKVEDIPSVFEAMGLPATKEEIETLAEEMDADGGGEIDFPEFCLMMGDFMEDGDKVMDEVIKCFKAFDPDQSGYIPVKQMIEAMVLMGDKMPKMDVGEMIALVGMEDGYVDYEAVIERVAKDSRNETPEEKIDSQSEKKKKEKEKK